MAVSLEDYFRTTFEDKLLVKMPEREDDHLTPATRLLEKRREMAEVEQALAAQKEEFQMKMESLQQRREELERKEYQLKKSLLQFDKFLKDNDSKKARAVKKANDEREMKRQKEKEIDKLKEETDDLVRNKDKLSRKLDNYSIYHKYMEKALERGEEFHEMRDVIARYDTLTATHEDLLKSDQKNQEVIEKHRQHLMKYIEEKDNEILGYNNQLSSLQTRLDQSQSEAVKWESQWTHIKNTAAKKTLELGRIKMATHNLYQLVKRHQKQAAQAEETPDQLNQVYLVDSDHYTSLTTSHLLDEVVVYVTGILCGMICWMVTLLYCSNLFKWINVMWFTPGSVYTWSNILKLRLDTSNKYQASDRLKHRLFSFSTNQMLEISDWSLFLPGSFNILDPDKKQL